MPSGAKEKRDRDLEFRRGSRQFTGSQERVEDLLLGNPETMEHRGESSITGFCMGPSCPLYLIQIKLR